MGFIKNENARVRALTAGIIFAGAFACLGIASAQEPIRIGAFLSVTGPAAFLGDPEQTRQGDWNRRSPRTRSRNILNS